MIYLDNAATTMVKPIVTDAIMNSLDYNWGNCSSLCSVGEDSKNILNNCRERVAKILNCRPCEVYFNSGATEGNNTVINTYKRYGSMIVTDKIEHKSVLNALTSNGNDNYYYYTLNVDRYGRPDSEEIGRLCDSYDKTVDGNLLFSIMYVNNVLGNINNIKEMAEKVHSVGGYFHTDATQAVGHCSLDVKELGVDYLTLSGHKFGAPKGVGILYVKNGVPFFPLIYGGEQEGRKRAGTENLPYIEGITIALEEAVKDMDCTNRENKSNFDELINYLTILSGTKDFPSVRINTNTDSCTHHILNFGLYNISAETLMLVLDSLGVVVGSGSACSSGSPDANYVLEAINVPKAYLNSSIRVSFGYNTHREDINGFVDKLQEAIKIIKTEIKKN